jgi:hypothetical protein
LRELEIEERYRLNEYKDVDEVEDEDEDVVEEERSEEEELVSSQDIEHGVIVVASQR